MIAFNCPTCEKRFKLSDRFAGRNLFCSGCKTEIVVPEPEEELGLAPIPEERSPEDIYSNPRAIPIEVCLTGSNIEFDCSNCGKHFAFTRRFAGREMLCSGCRSELTIPAASESDPVETPDLFDTLPTFPAPPPPPPGFDTDSVPHPPPLPASPETVSHPTFPPLPPDFGDDLPELPVPPPPPGSFTSSSGFAGFDVTPTGLEDDTWRYENAMAVRTDEDSAILAYVYHEKHNEPQSVEPAPSPPLPVPDVSPPKRRNLTFWLMISVVLILIFGTCLYLNLFVDWSGPDRRPAMLERIARRKTEAGTEAAARENEAELQRFKAMEAWNTAGELADNFLVTLGERNTKQNMDESFEARRQRLDNFRQQIRDTLKKAGDAENAVRKAAGDRDRLRAEARFFEEEETKLAERIRSNPRDRSDVPFPEFQPSDNVPITEEQPRLDVDWTENGMAHFGFSGVSADYLFTTFDGVRRLFGNRSLRLSLLEREAVTIAFPAGGELRQDCRGVRSFLFSIRFPGIGDRLIAGGDQDEGKIGQFQVRFVNSAGHVDFRTDSPRYCEALYYEAAGKFVTVEIPLEGDSFWHRTDHFDLEKMDRSDDLIAAALSGRSDTPAALEKGADAFFHRIDRMEIRFMPLSDRTTVWLDGVTASEKEATLPYDLERAESLQSQIRNQDRLLRQQRGAVAEDAEKSDDEPAEEARMMPEQEEPLEFAGAAEERLRKQFAWILKECNGRLQARIHDRLQSFGPGSPIPDSLDKVVIEEVDLSRSRNVTDEKLDQLGILKDLKKLNLSHTGLKNESLIKLSTLTALETLNLGGNDLTFEGMPGIQTLKNLRELNLDGIRSSVEGIDALGNLTGLRSLSLARSLTDSGDLIYLLTLTNLETLDLSGSKIGDRALETLRAFPTLQSLNISKTRVTGAGVARLDNLRNLRHLNLSETAVNDSCLKAFRNLENMETVSAKKTKITRDGIRHTLGAAWVGRFELSD